MQWSSVSTSVYNIVSIVYIHFIFTEKEYVYTQQDGVCFTGPEAKIIPKVYRIII